MLAGLVLVALPMDKGDEAAPTLALLLLAGLVVASAMSAALWFALRRDLGIPAQVALYAVLFNVLVVGVRFVLGPRGLYEVNARRVFESHLPIDGTDGASTVTVTVFSLYALVLSVLALRSRRRVATRLGVRRRRGRRALAFVVAALVLVLLTGSAGLVAVLLVADAGFDYLSFVFSSSVSGLVAVLLAGATWLAAATFHGAEKQAVALGRVAVVTSLFWVLLGFLALYHVLWVVYILLLTSVWPLRVVVPK